MKKSLTALNRLCCCVVILGLSWSSVSAEPVEKKPAGASQKEEATKPKSSRLPAPYGMLGLSDEQRAQILAVQASYDPRIEKLKNEIQQITEERNEKIKELLTAGQKARLGEIQAEAKAKKNASNK